MSNRCNVGSCSNDRRYKDRWIILPHVCELKFHKPAPEDYEKWEKKLDRPKYHVNPCTRVCSNHFRYGKPLHNNHVPSLHLRSYPTWAIPVSRVKGDLASVSEDIVCEVLAHMCQYAQERDLQLFADVLQNTVGLAVTSAQDLSAACFDLDKSVARTLIDRLVPLIPLGKCLESLAVFQHGAEIEGVKPIRRQRPVPSTSLSTPATDGLLPVLQSHVHAFHSYCSVSSPPNVPEKDHGYCVLESTAVPSSDVVPEPATGISSAGTVSKPCKKRSCEKKISSLQAKVKALETEVKHLKTKVRTRTRQRNEKQEQINELKAQKSKPTTNKSPHICMEMLKESDHLVSLHTGLPTYALFCWVLSQVREVASNMTYWDGSGVEAREATQTRKPGPTRHMPLDDELLISLMKLKLNMSGEYLAFLFGLSASTVSSIISTWIPMLSEELAGLIYWSSREEVKACYPYCFRKWPGITAILDCFEIPTERPSHVEANSQIFSSYKNRPTSKFLLACTPGGSISYISPAAGGNMSDKEMVMKCDIIQKFTPGDKCLVDKGFRIQGELLEHGVELIIPPFVRQGKPFTDEENKSNKNIAHSRIHVERVIGRLRDYTFLKGVIPITQLDIITPAVRVCCALTNLKNSVVS